MDTDNEVGDFQDSLFNYAFHSPGHIDSPAERLEELRAFMAEKNLQMPKRYSSFVRVGRRGGGGKFVRIGKKNGLDEEGDQNTDAFQYYVPESIGFPGKRQMHRFIRIGRGMEGNDHGDGMLAEGGSLGDLDVNSFARYRKAPSSFVRIGKAPNKFLRIGKSPSSFVRIGKAPNNFVRIGKSPSNFVRIGRALSDAPDIYNDKRSSSFVRIGRSVHQADTPVDNVAKRSSSFVRIGKTPSDLDNLAKRPSGFVRIGKSADEQNFPKRASSFVRIGKSSLLTKDTDIDNMKKASSFVRIGKTLQNLNEDAGSTKKRSGNFLRIGRLASLDEKVNKRGFVRIGKKEDKAGSTTLDSPSPSDESMSNEKPTGDRGPINLTNRGSAFVRIGKIPSSAFVRIGKNSDVMVEEEPARVYSFNRGSRGGHSSFVRIG
ncbi:hypothetical protein RRG08_008367 [Elysia crispata]|uniref:Uncharacterized protein n=1 Tax=Elysia crispata TaxID=231223 RepID=A0AAE0Z393_9GAST|nr:hypothetical protein RRG08_008367 [Elysia crispata]